MFGYVVPDKPNMYVKDFALFRSYYCGLCHATHKVCGQVARFTVNYDVTFISVLFHDLLNVPVKVVKKRCILNPKRRPVIAVTPLMKDMVRLNMILAGLKCADNKADGDGAFARLAFSRKIKKARRALPQVAGFADDCFKAQQEVEKGKAGIDASAEPFANMMKCVFGYFAGTVSDENILRLGYMLGKFVYTMDALDDYDRDVKKGGYNAFYNMYGEPCYKTLVQSHAADIKCVLDGVIDAVAECYKGISVTENEGVITNVLWYGLHDRANAVLNKEGKKCIKIRL